MADYGEEVQQKMMSFIRYIEYDEDEKRLIDIVNTAEKEIVDKIKRQNGNQTDSDDDPIDPQFKGENLRFISYRNETKVHNHIITLIEMHYKNYPTTLQQDQELEKDETLSQNHRNALLFRIGEKEICEFMIASSKFCLGLLEGNFVTAKNTYNRIPR